VRVVALKHKTELKLIMKTKLQNVLRNDVSPFFFALSCALLVCISFTAKVLADDLQNAVSGPMENMMMTAEGQILSAVE
jgi:hypothetical protein